MGSSSLTIAQAPALTRSSSAATADMQSLTAEMQSLTIGTLGSRVTQRSIWSSLPSELRGTITGHLIPDMVVQISPGGGSFSINHDLGRGFPSPYEYMQLSRIVEHREIRLVSELALLQGTGRDGRRQAEFIDFNRRMADRVKSYWVHRWYDPIPDPDSDARMRTFFRMVQVSRTVSTETIAATIPRAVIIVTPGEPFFEKLTRGQKLLAAKTRNLVLRYPPCTWLVDGYNRFIAHLPLLETIVAPTLELTVNAPTEFWHGREIACGMYARNPFAHSIIRAFLGSILVCDWFRINTQSPCKLIREVFICNTAELDNVGRPAGSPRAGLHVIFGRNVTYRPGDLVIQGVYWRENCRPEDRSTWQQLIDHQSRWNSLERAQQGPSDASEILTQISDPMFFESHGYSPTTEAFAWTRFVNWHRLHQQYMNSHGLRTDVTSSLTHLIGRVTHAQSSTADI